MAIRESKALQSSGANLSLRASWSSDGGKSWSTSMAVASYADAMSQRARLSSDSDGTVRAVRYDSRSSDWRWKVFTAVLNRSQGWGEPKMLGGTGNCTWPSADKGIVAFTSDGAAERTQRDITHQISARWPDLPRAGDGSPCHSRRGGPGRPRTKCRAGAAQQ